MPNLGQKEEALLEYIKKYAHAQFSVINEFSGDITGESVQLFKDIEGETDLCFFEDVHTGQIINTVEFREYVFPARMIEIYEEYINDL